MPHSCARLFLLLPLLLTLLPCLAASPSSSQQLNDTALSNAALPGGSWEAIGPTFSDAGERAEGLAISPLGGDIRIYVHTDQNIWHIDGGIGSLASPFSPLEHLDVDPLQPRKLILINGQFFGHSEDHGQSVDYFPTVGRFSPRDARYNPRDPRQAYVVGNLSGGGETQSFAYRSWDGGQTWESWLSLAGRFIHWTIRVAPDDAQHLFVGGDGLQHSLDGGETWTSLIDFDLGQLSPYIYSLDFGAQDPDILWIATGFDGVLRSTDGGATFEVRNNGLSQPALDVIVASPWDPAVAFVLNRDGRIEATFDGGALWQPFEMGLPGDARVVDLKLDPRYGNTLYALTAERIFRRRLAPAASNRVCRECLPTPNSTAMIDDPFLDRQASGWDASSPARSRARALQHTSTQQPAQGPSKQHTSPDWQRIGPDGGTIQHFATTPADSETIYAAALASVWRSTNNGLLWQLQGVVPRGEIQALHVDAVDPLRLYVDAGVEGFWRSDDGGSTWRDITENVVEPNEFPYPQRLAVSPTESGHLVAGTVRGMYHSFDGGEMWELRYDDQPRLCQVFIPTLTPTTLLAQSCLLETPPIGRPWGLWRSDDNGQSWSQIFDGTLGTELFDHPTDPDRLFAQGPGYWPLLSSFDGGESWYPRGSHPNLGHTLDVAVHPTRPSFHLMLTRDGLLASDDDGFRFDFVRDDPDLQNTTFQDLTFASGLRPDGTGPFVFVATHEGVVRSRGGAQQWAPVNQGLSAWKITSLQYVEGSANREASLVTLAQGCPWRWRATDGWRLLSENCLEPMLTLAAAPANADILYAFDRFRLWRTTNGGENWQVLPRIEGFTPRELAVDPRDPDTLYVAGRTRLLDIFAATLYRSSDGGQSWQDITPTSLGGDDLYGIALAPSDPDRLYAIGGGIYQRFEDGSWGQRIVDWTPSAGPTVVDIAFVPPTAPGAAGVYYAASLEHGVFRGSASQLAQPTNNVGLPEGPVHSITVASNGTIYAGLDSGLYSSQDAGASWQPASADDTLQQQLLSRSITALTTSASGAVFAGTPDTGILSSN